MSAKAAVERLMQYVGDDRCREVFSWAIYGWQVAFLTHLDDYAVAAYEMGVRFLGRAYSGEDTFHFADGLATGARSLWDEDNPSASGVHSRDSRLILSPLKKVTQRRKSLS